MLDNICLSAMTGSIHDQRVFRISEVVDHLNGNMRFPGDGRHILRDTGYEVHQHVLTSNRDNEHLTKKQK